MPHTEHVRALCQNCGSKTVLTCHGREPTEEALLDQNWLWDNDCGCKYRRIADMILTLKDKEVKLLYLEVVEDLPTQKKTYVKRQLKERS